MGLLTLSLRKEQREMPEDISNMQTLEFISQKDFNNMQRKREKLSMLSISIQLILLEEYLLMLLISFYALICLKALFME